MVAQVDGVGEGLEGKGVRVDSRNPPEIGHRSQCQDEMVEREHQGAGLKSRSQGDGLVFKVDRVDVPDVQLGAGQQPVKGADRVQHADTAGDDLGQHGLENEVVLLADEDDLHVVTPAEPFLQGDGGVDASEPAAEDDDPFPRDLSGHNPHRLVSETGFEVPEWIRA